MAYIFATNHLSQFGYAGAVTEVTNAGRFDAAYCQSGIQISNTTDQLVYTLDNSVSGNLFLRFDMYAYLTSQFLGGYFVSAQNGNGEEIAAFYLNANGFNVGYTNDAGVRVSLGTFAMASQTLYSFVVNFDTTGSKALRFWMGGIEIGSISSGLPSRFTDIKSFTFMTPNTNVSLKLAVYSRFCLATHDLRPDVQHFVRANGNGAVAAPTGSYTDVSAIPYTGSTSRYLENVGDAFTMTKPAVVVPAGHSISSVIINDSILQTGSTVTGADHIMRIDGTNYKKPITPSLSITYGKRFTEWDANPATGDRFTQAELNAMQFGLEGKA